MTFIFRFSWMSSILFLLVGCVGVLGDGGRAAVGTRDFEVWYQVNEDAKPLHSVLVWFTRDMGRTWHLAGRDHDRESPLPFHAEDDGRYGFYVVATNAFGASADPPGPGVLPQFDVFVDSTPPIVQIHPVTVSEVGDGLRMMEISWSAVDDHLVDRPIELAYRVVPTNSWTLIVRRMANAGRYQWRLPEELAGKIVVRVTARDRGGHRVSARSEAVGVALPGALDQDARDAALLDSGWLFDFPDARSHVSDRSLGTKEAAVARRMLEQAEYHRRRGEEELAIVRYRDSLKSDPTVVAALVGLGGLLYDRDLGASVQAYELALRQRPLDRGALTGLARAQVKGRDYAGAERSLADLLKRYPDDVEAWLHLGDVAVYRGDSVAAAQHYRMSMSRKPSVGEVVKRARKRLENLDQLTNLYASESP